MGPNALAVTGCLANFYQSAGTSAADGVCTACVGGTLAAAAFGSSTTTCVATCTLPALGYKIVKGTCGAAGQTAAAGSTCAVAAETGYAFAGSADNVCAASSASFTPNALAVTGCLANFYQSAGTSATDGVCTACGDKGTLAAAAFGGATTVCTCAAGYTGADCATHSCAGVAGKPTWSTVSPACVVAGSDDATCAAIDAAKPAWSTVSTACVAAGSTDATCAAI